MNFEKCQAELFSEILITESVSWIRCLDWPFVHALTCIPVFVEIFLRRFRYLLNVSIILEISSRWMNLTELHDKATILPLIECGSYEFFFLLAGEGFIGDFIKKYGLLGIPLGIAIILVIAISCVTGEKEIEEAPPE